MIFLHHVLVTVNNCLSDTIEKSKFGTNSSLKTMRKDNFNKLIFANMNINSIQNKLDSLADIIKDNIDILMISETKVGDSFPDGQFFLDGFGTTFRLDRNRNGGGILLFVRNDTPAKVVSTDDRAIESFYAELNFQKKKWLLNCSYNPKHSSIESHLDSHSKSVDSLSSKYYNFILLGDFKSYMEDSPMKTFAEIYKLPNLIKEPVCFKNPDNLTCIDLILTNKPLSFKNTNVIETRLSDFHKMMVAVMKIHFPKMKPQVVSYRKYKGFHNETFLDSLRHELNAQGQFLNEKVPDPFPTICSESLDKHAPEKSDIYGITISLSLIMKFLRQS